MPRPTLPSEVTVPLPVSFKLDRHARKAIDRTLGRTDRNAELAEVIEYAISWHLGRPGGSRSTTVANTALVLRRARSKGRGWREAVEVLAHDRSGVDSETHRLLKPLAEAALAGAPGAGEVLAESAGGRERALDDHPRVSPSAEQFRFLCAIMRETFRYFGQAVLLTCSETEGWRRCRHFATTIFGAAGIDWERFAYHPARLEELLKSELPELWPETSPDWYLRWRASRDNT